MKDRRRFENDEERYRNQMARPRRPRCQDGSTFACGCSVQNGSERAPITAYNRISSDVIRVHSNIYHPDYVVVVDETLLDSVDVTAGLKETGAIIINTPKKREDMIPKLNGYKGRVYAIDARHISVETLGKNFPNSPMLAATVAVSEVMEKETFIHEMRASYEHKFAKKPEVIDGNMEALERAFDVVSIDIQKDKEAMA